MAYPGSNRYERVMERVIIVGGGLSGCAVALELATRGVKVEVLERAIVGAEASSAAAGILSPRMEAHGREPFRGYGLESLAMYPAWVARLGDVGFRRCGLLRVGEKPDVDAEEVDAASIERGLSAARAWWLPEEATVDTRRLVTAVHDAAVAAGARFRTGATVRAVHPDAVSLDGERVTGRVVVCAGAWTSRVPGLAGVPVRPVRGQLCALQGVALRTVVFGAGGYLVPRHDEVVCGATAEEVEFTRGTTAGGVRAVLDTAVGLMPALAGAAFDRAWSGFRPGTPDDLPVMGRVDGVWVASGHFRNGILLAPLTARWTADALLDGAELPPAFSPSRFSTLG